MRISILALLFFALPLHAQNEAVTASNQFAFDCLKVLETEKGNIAFSPYSLWIALSITSAGAAGSTLVEMDKTLHIPKNSRDSIHQNAGEWIMELKQAKEIDLKTANRQWVDSSVPLEKNYTDLLTKNYGSSLESVDFSKNGEAIRTQINLWVAQQTADRILNLLAPSDITPATRLVLVNAVYFKAGWKREFPDYKTLNLPFTKSNGEVVHGLTMQEKDDYPYFENDQCQAIRLAYKGNQTSMVVVLPRKNIHYRGTLAEFQKILESLKEAEVKVQLPRFLIEKRIKAVPLLESLGMKSAFSNTADFSQMSKQRNLMVGNIVHQSFIRVGEKGTEAAATAMRFIAVFGVSTEEVKPKEFIADHPFLFFIVHDPSGGILFAGHVDEPEPKPEVKEDEEDDPEKEPQ